MDTKISIDGKEVGFRATARTPRIYRHKFGRDVIQDLQILQKNFLRAQKSAQTEQPGAGATDAEIEAYETAMQDAKLSVIDLEVFENIAWVMAKQFDQHIPDNPDAWLDEFTTFSIYEILPDILTLWTGNQKTTSEAKNA